MATPSISNPYRVLAAYALGRQPGAIDESDIADAEKWAASVCSSDPPLLSKFLSFYSVSPFSKTTAEVAEQAEKLLRCIWRGDLDSAFDPTPGPYRHFKGDVYTVHSKALLLQGPKEEWAVVYANSGGAFVRPLREWAELVLWPDGEYHPRFMRVV